jgi:hypothetical protein
LELEEELGPGPELEFEHGLVVLATSSGSQDDDFRRHEPAAGDFAPSIPSSVHGDWRPPFDLEAATEEEEKKKKKQGKI